MRHQHYTSSKNNKGGHNKNKPVIKASMLCCKHGGVNLDNVKRKRVVRPIQMDNMCKKTRTLSLEEEHELRLMILILTIITTKKDTLTY